MFYELSFPPQRWKEEPDKNSKSGEIISAQTLKKIGENDDGTWFNLQRTSAAGVTFTGWLKADELEEVPAPERPEIILWGFLKTCVTAELAVNALSDTDPNFVNADFLIALALYESKIQNVGEKTPGTDAAGPFQITSARWKEMLEKSTKAAAEDRDFAFTELQREYYWRQIFGIALLTREDTRAISEAITKHDKAAGTNPTAAKTGPYIPTYSDVFIAAVAGVNAAVTLRKLEIGKKGDTVITDLVKELAEDRQKEMERIFKHNFHIFNVNKTEAESKGIAAGPRTVQNLYEKVETKLDQLFAEAFKLIKENIPEDVPFVSGVSGASWLPIANTEFNTVWDKGKIKETDPVGKTRALDYFKATDLKTNKVLAWCGAFAAHCMQQGGAPFIPGAARAANWKKWGNVSIPLGAKDIPDGAVVVLSPPAGNTERSGHVAFYAKEQSKNAGKFVLLGGNQSDTVKYTPYARSKVAAIRWFSTTGVGADSASVAKLNPLLNLIGAHESNNNYDAYYAHASNKTDPQLTVMSVDEVLAWQRKFVKNGSPSSAAGWYQIIQKTLVGLKQSLNLSGTEKFDKILQDQMAVGLLNQRGLARFLKGALSETAFANSISKEWASFPKATKPNPEISYYNGDGLNKAGVSVAEVHSALQEIKRLHTV